MYEYVRICTLALYYNMKYKLHISETTFYCYSLSRRIQIIVLTLVKLSSSDNSKCSSVDECSPVEVRQNYWNGLHTIIPVITFHCWKSFLKMWRIIMGTHSNVVEMKGQLHLKRRDENKRRICWWRIILRWFSF